jgi:hypothetical protein
MSTPLTEQEARQAKRQLVDFLNRRLPGSEAVLILENMAGRVAFYQNSQLTYYYDKPLDDHNFLNAVIDVMTPTELSIMRNALCRHWRNLKSWMTFAEWLIKHDHVAFVAAALVAIGAGKGES